MRIVGTIVAILLTASVRLLHASELPVDVKTFLEKREACDHWRGESGEGDPVRQYEINKNACELCQGTDAELAALRKKYGRNQGVVDTMKPLQENVETPSPQAMKNACQQALSNPPKGANPTAKPSK